MPETYRATAAPSTDEPAGCGKSRSTNRTLGNRERNETIAVTRRGPGPLRGRRHRGTLRGVTGTDQITFEFDPFDPRVLTVDGGMWMHTPLYGEQMRQV
jgi:hypothetical protein